MVRQTFQARQSCQIVSVAAYVIDASETCPTPVTIKVTELLLV
jgi:hypothetical protein